MGTTPSSGSRSTKLHSKPARRSSVAIDAKQSIAPETMAVALVLALSIEKAAYAADIGRTLMYSLLDVEGGIPTFTIGKRRLIRVEALREFLLRREQEAISER